MQLDLLLFCSLNALRNYVISCVMFAWDGWEPWLNICRVNTTFQGFIEIGDTLTKENNVGTLKLNTRIETDCKNNDS